MIDVSNDFKEAAKSTSKLGVFSYVTDGTDEITEDDDLQSLKINSDGSLCKTIMRQADISYFGSHDYSGEELNLGIGLKLPEVISKGNFAVTIAAPAILTLTAHGLYTSAQVKLTTSGALPTGLVVGTSYYVIVIDDDTFYLATSVDSAYNDVKITTTGTQSGTHSLNFYPGTGGGSVEYIDYGKFRIGDPDPLNTPSASEKATDITSLTLYDKMHDALQTFALESGVDITYPATLLDLVNAICTKLSWTLATGSDSFPNDDLVIPSDIFADLGLTYRQVLEWVAESAASIIRFNTDDELVILQVSKDTIVETLTSNEVKNLSLQKHYGEINSVILSRQPQEDNIVDQDATSISTYGLTEIKFENNLIVDSDRETYIIPIFNELFHLEFTPFTSETNGLCYLEIGDRIIVTDLESNTYEVIVLNISIEVDGSIQETIGCNVPIKTSTAYNTAGIIGQTIRNTQIIVNKVSGEIDLITSDLSENYYTKTETSAEITLATDSINSTVSAIATTVNEQTGQIDTLESEVTTLTETADSLSARIEQTGGTNLLKNSVGLKGDIKEWQLYVDDVLSDSRNNGTIVQTTDVINNSESGSAINLQDQFIFQTLSTIIGSDYTFYCRYKSTDDATLSITGIDDITLPASADWVIYKTLLTASAVSTTVQIENSTSDSITLSDNVFKLGDVTGWVQAPNEIYGANYKFDKDGFEISSLTDNFKSRLTNSALEVLDTSGGDERIIMEITKDEALLTQAVIQEAVTIQRYGNSSKALRIIATATGSMEVIND